MKTADIRFSCQKQLNIHIHVFRGYIKGQKKYRYDEGKVGYQLFKSKNLFCWRGVFCSQTLIVTLMWKQCRSVFDQK